MGFFDFFSGLFGGGANKGAAASGGDEQQPPVGDLNQDPRAPRRPGGRKNPTLQIDMSNPGGPSITDIDSGGYGNTPGASLGPPDERMLAAHQQAHEAAMARARAQNNPQPAASAAPQAVNPLAATVAADPAALARAPTVAATPRPR